MLAGSDAAPAGGDERTPAPGRPGKPTGGHYDPSARSSLDWDWRQCLVPGSADPGPVSLATSRRREPRWSAGRRPHSRKGMRTDGYGRASRRSITSACSRGKGKTGVPAPVYNRGDVARPPSRQATAGSLRNRRLASRSSAGAKAGVPGAAKNTGDDACADAGEKYHPLRSAGDQQDRSAVQKKVGQSRTSSSRRAGGGRGSKIKRGARKAPRLL